MQVIPSGLTYEQAIEWVREQAVKALEHAPLGIWTEMGKRSVMIGIARAGGNACVIEVDRAEYDGTKLLEMIT